MNGKLILAAVAQDELELRKLAGDRLGFFERMNRAYNDVVHLPLLQIACLSHHNNVIGDYFILALQFFVIAVPLDLEVRLPYHYRAFKNKIALQNPCIPGHGLVPEISHSPRRQNDRQ